MTLSIEVLLRKKVYNFDNPLTLKTSKEDLLLGLLCYIGTSTWIVLNVESWSRSFMIQYRYKQKLKRKIGFLIEDGCNIYLINLLPLSPPSRLCDWNNYNQHQNQFSRQGWFFAISSSGNWNGRDMVRWLEHILQLFYIRINATLMFFLYILWAWFSIIGSYSPLMLRDHNLWFICTAIQDVMLLHKHDFRRI